MTALGATPLLSVMAAGLCFAVLGLSYKLASVHNCRAMGFGTVFLLVAMLLAGARALCETTAWADPRLWWLGGAMGLSLYAALALVVTVNRMGPASVTWTILNLSILIPILLAPALLGERWRPADAGLLALFGLLLLALRHGLRATADEDGLPAPSYWPLLGLMWALNGTFQFGSKLKDTFFHQSSSAGLATVYFAVALVLALSSHLLQTRGDRISPREWSIGALAGGCAGIGSLFMLHGLSLPVIVAYPVSQGISLVGGVALTTILFHERLNAGKLIGFALSLAVLVLAVWR